jgi:hypothetical protein
LEEPIGTEPACVIYFLNPMWWRGPAFNRVVPGNLLFKSHVVEGARLWRGMRRDLIVMSPAC